MNLLPGERHITLAQAAKLIPGRPSKQAVYRWATTGFRGVVLEHFYCGRKLVTSVEAVERFVQAMNQRVSHPAAERELSAEGL